MRKEQKGQVIVLWQKLRLRIKVKCLVCLVRNFASTKVGIGRLKIKQAPTQPLSMIILSVTQWLPKIAAR